jgi:hypothetical protein
MTPAGVTADYPQVVQEYLRLAPEPSRLESFLSRTKAFWLRDPYLEPVPKPSSPLSGRF